jgi:hypothetical protein
LTKVWYVCRKCRDVYQERDIDFESLPEYGCIDSGHCRIVIDKFDNSTLTRMDVTYPVKVEFASSDDSVEILGALGNDYRRSHAEAVKVANGIVCMLEYNGIEYEIVDKTGENDES